MPCVQCPFIGSAYILAIYIKACIFSLYILVYIIYLCYTLTINPAIGLNKGVHMETVLEDLLNYKSKRERELCTLEDRMAVTYQDSYFKNRVRVAEILNTILDLRDAEETIREKHKATLCYNLRLLSDILKEDK